MQVRKSKSTRGPLPFPARALRIRLLQVQEAAELPEWACHLRGSAAPQWSMQITREDGVSSAQVLQLPPMPGLASHVPDTVTHRIARQWCAKALEGDGSVSACALSARSTTLAATPSAATASVVGRIWLLSRDPVGCRLVQQAFEDVDDHQGREAMVRELHDHVWEAMTCPHANHVIQKVIATTRPESFQFIVEELAQPANGIQRVARHRHGCRIIQRLLDRGTAAQVQRITDDIVVASVSLSMDPYGNYVVQHVFESGDVGSRRALAQALARDVGLLGSNSYGRAVVSRALGCSEAEHQREIANALLCEPGLLAAMACTWHGHFAARWVLHALEGAELAEACHRLKAKAQELQNSRYGRSILAAVESVCQNTLGKAAGPASGFTRL